MGSSRDPQAASGRPGSGVEADEGDEAMTPAGRNKHWGSSLDDFLKEEGVYEEAKRQVAKETIAWQIERAMKEKNLSKKRMAELMETSRTQVDRLLNPKDHNVTLATLEKAAAIVGRQLRLELV
jgi:predicted XRE-type DNA-binding protein